MSSWKPVIDLSLPYWDDYRELIDQLPAEEFPDAAALNALLPGDVFNQRGLPVQFVPASLTTGTSYEKHIFETGQVSTREGNWHDLFNALVWCRLPRMKTAMNALHYERLGQEKDGRRGRVRDSLTLLDESGVIVLGSNRENLQTLVARDWTRVFLSRPDTWREQLRVIVCGHALLEKFLNPYKAITAHALLLCLDEGEPCLPRNVALTAVDERLSRDLLSGRLLDSSVSLSPLPLMGIPGWAAQQDQAFYDDDDVFRPGRKDQRLAKVKNFQLP